LNVIADIADLADRYMLEISKVSHQPPKTTTYCVAVKKGKSEILSVKYFYFLKKMFSIVQKETTPHGHNLHWVRI
jgi:hypothetical protein